jgi:hypothetical protein
MTCEIALMNKSAVALAADSAVTVSLGYRNHITNSENKLFMLSKNRPIGVMFYNVTDFLGVPLETIIKNYRHSLEDAWFPTVEKHATHFLAHLEASKEYYPQGSANLYIERHVVAERERRDHLMEKFSIEPQHYKTLRLSELRKSEPQHYSNGLEKALGLPKVLDGVGIEDDLKEIIELRITRGFDQDISFGLVFAGFGQDEVFPSLRAVEIEGGAQGAIKLKLSNSENISLQNPAVLASFAQTDTITGLAQGAHPELWKHIKDTLSHYFIDTVPEQLREKIEKLQGEPSEVAKVLKEEAKTFLAGVLRDFEADVLNWIQHERSQALRLAIAMASKEALSEIAESLVNVASLQQKISFSEETVGGPIDVAIITRGDGFIWMRRKHYFEPDLNPSYFQNYKTR